MNSKEIKIIRMTFDNKDHYEKKDYPFTVIGKLLPKLECGVWSYQEELYEQPYDSKYSEDQDLDDYINSDDSAAFLYYSGVECLGHVRVSSNEEIKFASIDRLIVLENSRGNGIGTELLHAAKEWAHQKEMKGVMLETQDVNLLACRFYLKNNFEIGAVDTKLYSNSKFKDETAIFFYSIF